MPAGKAILIVIFLLNWRTVNAWSVHTEHHAGGVRHDGSRQTVPVTGHSWPEALVVAVHPR